MQRLYYSISEVAQILDEETYVLRYWEKEFPQVSPKKNKSGKRVYSDSDISILKIVKNYNNSRHWYVRKNKDV